MADDVEKIARGMTKAQRETLFDGRRCVASYKPAQKLVEMGIWNGEGDEYTIYPFLTPLGAAVRSYLKDHEHG